MRPHARQARSISLWPRASLKCSRHSESFSGMTRFMPRYSTLGIDGSLCVVVGAYGIYSALASRRLEAAAHLEKRAPSQLELQLCMMRAEPVGGIAHPRFMVIRQSFTWRHLPGA